MEDSLNDANVYIVIATLIGSTLIALTGVLPLRILPKSVDNILDYSSGGMTFFYLIYAFKAFTNSMENKQLNLILFIKDCNEFPQRGFTEFLEDTGSIFRKNCYLLSSYDVITKESGYEL